MKAYCGLRLFRGESSFYSWLHRIAINSAATAISLRTRNASLGLPDTPSAAADQGAMQGRDLDSPESLALADEICDGVNSAIEDLCEEQRVAIVLREFNGLSYKQVMAAMFCPVGTVRSRVFRAREAIDRRLRGVFDDGHGRARSKRALHARSIRELGLLHMTEPCVLHLTTGGANPSIFHLLCAPAIAVSLTACATIPTGRTGVEWTPTKGTVERTMGEGFHVVSRFSRIYDVDLFEQQQDVSLDVLADNRLDIMLKTSILYQPTAGEAVDLIKQTGPNYHAVLVAPHVRSSARRVVGRYSPEEIYSTKREQIEREIRQDVDQKPIGKHIQVNAILVREVHLPPVVQSAIQAKLEEEQKAWR